MDWNQLRPTPSRPRRRVPPVQHSRANAMLHVAMFEAVNAIERRYAPYRLNLSADRNRLEGSGGGIRSP